MIFGLTLPKTVLDLPIKAAVTRFDFREFRYPVICPFSYSIRYLPAGMIIQINLNIQFNIRKYLPKLLIMDTNFNISLK
jgi:hypothetical protein